MRVRRTLLVFAAAVCWGALTPARATGQAEVVLEFGGSQVGAASDLEQDPGRFVVGGMRASWFAPSGSGAGASLLAGRSLDGTTGGDFVSASAGGSWLGRLGSGWSAGIDARAFGFEVDAPFRYRALALEGGPTLRHKSARTHLRIDAIGGVGRSRVEIRQRLRDGVRTVEDDLWRVGTEAEFLLGSRRAMAGLAAAAHRTAGGDYGSVGGRLIGEVAGLVAEVRIDRWSTPAGTETTGGLAFVMAGPTRWSLRGFFGRSDPDLLTLTEPGSTGAGALAGLVLLRSAPTAGSPVHRVIEPTAQGAMVELRLRGRGDATSAAVAGDFTLWSEVAMERSGSDWVARVEVPAGTHHFGFVVDGAWFVPTDAPDRVPDEWGRESATLVIER